MDTEYTLLESGASHLDSEHLQDFANWLQSRQFVKSGKTQESDLWNSFLLESGTRTLISTTYISKKQTPLRDSSIFACLEILNGSVFIFSVNE